MEEKRTIELDKMATDLLNDPKLLDKLVKEISKKIAGEKDTIKAILLHLLGSLVKNTSIKTHLFVNSESSSGKSYICNQIRKIFPENCYEYKTKITPEVLTYWHNSKYEPEWTWDGKFLYLEDVRDDVLNSATFKIMASEGSKATVVIKQKAIDIEIKGSPVILLTSSNAIPNSEIINRFSIINLDETPEQTNRIIRKQLVIAINGEEDEYEEYFQEALSKLVRCKVILPQWISNLSNFFAEKNIRVRRDIGRFLDLMKASAVLHQYQRDFNTYGKLVYANEDDYEIARKVNEKIEDAGGSYGLTHRLKKCYDICLEKFREDNEYFSAGDMLKYKPVVSERAWRTILDKLSQRGLLSVDIRKPEEGGRPSTVFYPNLVDNIKLPIVTEVKEVKEDKTLNEYTEVTEDIEVSEVTEAK